MDQIARTHSQEDDIDEIDDDEDDEKAPTKSAPQVCAIRT